ncbi:MAG: acyl-CoA dehydrogenase [Candidatus Tectimicrobiota bacterium]|nr:MAG: acyl-CoA dehydrogenase [Candidatus Tectomicrobia bacterium]
MDFRFSEEQEQFRDTVRRFARSELAPYYREGDHTKAFPHRQLAAMAELGLTGLRIPEAWGGSLQPCLVSGIAAEEVARADFNCGYFVEQNAFLGELLWRFGSPQLQERYLPGMANGSLVMGIALTEPAVGSDAANLTTRAVREGDVYVLSGEKTSVSFAGAMDACVVFAKTDPRAGARGISAFVVRSEWDGVRRTVLPSIGSKCLLRGTLVLDGVRVPRDHLIGEEGKGFYMIMSGFDYARALIALMCIGCAMQSLEETMQYVKERHAFGRPIAKFEGVQFPIAEDYTLLEAARLLSYRCLWLKDEGLPHTKEASMCKWWAPKLAVEVIHHCLLLHGHYGYVEDMPFDQRLRDVMGLEIGDGTAQIQKIVVARELLGREFLPYR